MPTGKHRGRGRKFNNLISFTQRNQRKNRNWGKATKPQSSYNDVLTPVRLRNLSKQYHQLGPNVQICEPIETFLIQTTTVGEVQLCKHEGLSSIPTSCPKGSGVEQLMTVVYGMKRQRKEDSCGFLASESNQIGDHDVH